MIQRRIHPDRRIKFLTNQVIVERRKLIRRKKERQLINCKMFLGVIGVIISILFLSLYLFKF